MKDETLRCLVISDGRQGIENQALGLAEACTRLRPLTLITHHVQPGRGIAALPPRLQSYVAGYDLPACDIAIGCGRQAIAPLLHLKRTRPDVLTAYVQDPRIAPKYFDLVIAPEHDGVTGPNVITMIGSPNRITSEVLDAAREAFAAELEAYPAPRATFLIGGTSHTHRLSDTDLTEHLSHARDLLSKGYSLLVTTSRRTPDAAVTAWTALAAENARVWLHNAGQSNPYAAFLGAADRILVTEDSTNMLTESCATGQPVFRLPMTGKPGKFQTLYDALEKRCEVARYNGQTIVQGYQPLDETDRAAEAFWAKLDRKPN